MSIFSWIKDQLQKLKTRRALNNFAPGENYTSVALTQKDLVNCPRTEKLAKTSFPLYFIFNNISSNVLDDYKPDKISPYYIACTEEEAASACMYLTYVRNIEHYLLWCRSRNLKAGIAESSWIQYLDDTRGGLNTVLQEDFKVIVSHYTLGDLVSAMRMLQDSITILGLPTETPEETIAFLTRAELAKDSTPENPKLADIGDLDSQSFSDKHIYPLCGDLRCDTIGDFIGKLTLTDIKEFTGDPETGLPGCRTVWKGVISETGGKVSERTKAIYKQALQTDEKLVNMYRQK